MKRGIIIALLLSIITPLILSFILLTLLTPINWTQMTGGAPQILAILSFSTLAFPYNVPIFGYGYVIPLFMWLITGVFVGLFCKSVKKAAALTLLGIMIQVLLFAILTSMDPSFIPAFLQSPENTVLLGGFSTDFFITLGLFLFWYALTVPSGLIGSIMGGLVSRSSIPE
jgi:hypothetical protein